MQTNLLLVLEFIFMGALTASHYCFIGERLAVHRTLKGSSMCNTCGKPVRLSDVSPVVPWFLLRGKARCCGGPIPRRYPLMESLAGLWAGAAAVLIPSLPWAIAVALIGPGLVFTRSYNLSIKRALGLTPCQGHKESVQEGQAGIHRYLGAMRCGWCGRKVTIMSTDQTPQEVSA